MISTETRIQNYVPSPAQKSSQAGVLEDIAANVLRESGYSLIKNPDSFCRQYKKRISQENQEWNLQPRISDFGIFDTSSIDKPKKEEGKLVFFARNRHNLPYRVTCDLENCKTQYELLPYESSNSEKMQTK